MPRPGSEAVVLVTGFPSVYARRMAERILAEEPRSLVYAPLPRASLRRAEAARDALDEAQRARLVLLEGDASAIDLGLSGAEYRALAREVSRVHHVAHASSGALDSKAAFAANVASASEMVEFARAASSLELCVLHSTALVAGDRHGVVYEEELDRGQAFRSDAERTRMLAETVARRAMKELPIAVVRPTNLANEIDPGQEEPLDGLHLFALLIAATPHDIALPFPGKGDAPLHVVPLDFVVKASHAIGRTPEARGRTFHLADPHPLSARRVAEVLSHASGRRTGLGHIPSNLAKALLRTPGVDRFMKSPRAFVEQLSTPVRFDTSNADVILRGASIACPPFEAYASELVTLVQQHLKAQRQRRSPASMHEGEVEDSLS